MNPNLMGSHHICKCHWSAVKHQTFGECMRSKNIRVAYCQSASGKDFSRQKRWDKDLDAYASARRQGIQPDSTKSHAVQKAVEWSDREGKPYGSSGGA